MVVRVAVWHQTLLGEDIFLGQVHLLLSWLELGKEYEAWYALTPRKEEPSSPPGEGVGSMRLTVVYHEDTIYPAAVYHPLRVLLEESIIEQVGGWPVCGCVDRVKQSRLCYSIGVL